jgi:hypothetical protein
MAIRPTISFFGAKGTLLGKHLSRVAPTGVLEWRINLWSWSSPKHPLRN